MLPRRTKLLLCDREIKSSYSPSGHTGIDLDRASLRGLASTALGYFTPDACEALFKLHEAVLNAGGDFRVTDGFRSTETQSAARKKYENWLRDFQPAPNSKEFDPKRHKAAFVALPGRSFHNAGRAIDVHVDALRFPDVSRERQLDRLWELAIPLGWTPIIKAPTEGMSECWHFDFMGPWAPVVTRRGYEEAAIGAVLCTGDNSAFVACGSVRRIQSQLHRAGYDCGKIDGVFGPLTEAALYASGFRKLYSDTAAAIAWVDELADSPIVKFKRPGG